MSLKHTKIICTIGPACRQPEVLKKLVEAGMDVARLNFSHGTHEEHLSTILALRQISKELSCPIAIMADLQGPKLRLGKIPGVMKLRAGDRVVLSKNPKNGGIPLQFDLSPYVSVGQRMYLNDGLIEVQVEKIVPHAITVRVKNDGVISSFKGVNVPDTRLPDVFTEKDEKDARFALTHKVDYLAISFVQREDDLEKPRNLIATLHPPTKIMVKIEKGEAADHVSDIIHAADAVMVARGDLAIETSSSRVPVIQQEIITHTRSHQKPVVIATQMLESMTENPRPTRAEASDVAHAVLSQVDSVMLSAETATGKYPVETVKTMSEIIRSIEENPHFLHSIKVDWKEGARELLQSNALASASVSLVKQIGAPLIVVVTSSGQTAQLISSFRPQAQIVAVTPDPWVARQLNLVWGVYPLVLPFSKGEEGVWKKIAHEIISQKLVKKGTDIVMVNASDTIKVIKV